jgi:hypothetical protein
MSSSHSSLTSMRRVSMCSSMALLLGSPLMSTGCGPSQRHPPSTLCVTPSSASMLAIDIDGTFLPQHLRSIPLRWPPTWTPPLTRSMSSSLALASGSPKLIPVAAVGTSHSGKTIAHVVAPSFARTKAIGPPSGRLLPPHLPPSMSRTIRRGTRWSICFEKSTRKRWEQTNAGTRSTHRRCAALLPTPDEGSHPTAVCFPISSLLPSGRGPRSDCGRETMDW